jgi:hypothetical protein
MVLNYEKRVTTSHIKNAAHKVTKIAEYILGYFILSRCAGIKAGTKSTPTISGVIVRFIMAKIAPRIVKKIVTARISFNSAFTFIERFYHVTVICQGG